jgi:hypothetical protein
VRVWNDPVAAFRDNLPLAPRDASDWGVVSFIAALALLGAFYGWRWVKSAPTGVTRQKRKRSYLMVLVLLFFGIPLSLTDNFIIVAVGWLGGGNLIYWWLSRALGLPYAERRDEA